jgi:hypothetical protein
LKRLVIDRDFGMVDAIDRVMTIRVGFKAEQLEGQGLELLVVDGIVIAKFLDGMLVSGLSGEMPKGNNEITKVG